MTEHEQRKLGTGSMPQAGADPGTAIVDQPAVAGPRLVEVHIEELALHGFSPVDRLRIAAALEGELARLFGERGLPEGLAGGAQVDAIDAGSFVRGPLSTPVSIGDHVARAVYGGLHLR